MDEDEVEVPLAGGEVNEVVRVGDTVHRTAGAWTPSVQRVLAHLRAEGFDLSPAPLGTDDRGREVVSWLPGTTAARPWPAALLREDGVHQAAAAVVGLGAALATYEARPDDVWRHGGVPGPGSTTLRHGDLGLWNTVWSGDRLTGIIDWDYLEPSPPLWDLAQLCWYVLPVRPTRWAACGFDGEPDLDRRLAVVAEHAGCRPRDLLEVLDDLMGLDLERTLTWGGAGVHPWRHFLDAGYVLDIGTDRAFLRERWLRA
ncbi:hypothetical protein ENKNEFLB_04084 [Nocardioides aquaticus]|uniref:Aminoglycoside phosphotransferase domain-containing protein n=1 Tax=Nocardioides aquaticus TaxID=160826 RepID=A0ABX8ENZ8_9ACTN|nr:phosphotransferase [Nocardioides aquaticus]QVT81670.1 hypothetical protein ENKNEFLB_04084 [Nocardioides aquaticus]